MSERGGHRPLVRRVESVALAAGRAAPRRLLADAAEASGPLFEDAADPDRAVVTFVHQPSSPAPRWVLADTHLADAIEDDDADGEGGGAAAAPAPGLALEHLGAGVWAAAVEIPARFRGLYGYVAGRPGEALTPPSKWQDRAWWLALRQRTIADPLADVTRDVSTVWGTRSELAAPGADRQRWWDLGRAHFADHRFEHHLLRLHGVERSVWTFAAGTAGAATLVGFDGESWARHQNLAPSLAALAASGEVGDFAAVFVASIDIERRATELTCSASFRQALTDELLPWIGARFGVAERARTIVAGQSYGGLAATDAVLARPERFGAAVAQSPSYWWNGEQRPMPRPPRPPGAPGARPWIWHRRLAALADAGAAGDVRLRCSAGELEAGMLVDARRFVADAAALGVDATVQPFCGGHDVVHWREGLVTGLAELLTT